MIINKHFGKALSNYIDNRGLAVHKQAEKIGVSYQGYIKYYESENPRPITKNKILNGLGITEEELFGIEKVEENNEVIELKRINQELQFKLNVVYEELIQYKNKQNAELQAVNH